MNDFTSKVTLEETIGKEVDRIQFGNEEDIKRKRRMRVLAGRGLPEDYTHKTPDAKTAVLMSQRLAHSQRENVGVKMKESLR